MKSISIDVNLNAKYAHLVTSIEMKIGDVAGPPQTTGSVWIEITSSCPRPYFFARLAGPALIGMKSMHHYHAEDGSRLDRVFYDDLDREMSRQVQFPYPFVAPINYKGTLTRIEMDPIPLDGSYRLEILQTMCDTPYVLLAHECLATNQTELVLNQDAAVTTYDLMSTTLPGTNNLQGCWKRKKDFSSVSSSPIVQARYQADKQCQHHAGSTCDLSWFDAYEYHFISPDFSSVHDAWNADTLASKVICSIGDSHSRNLHESMQKLLIARNLQSIADQFRYIQLRYPNEWKERHVNHTTRAQCTHVILAAGQWPLSFHSPGGMMLPGKWINGVRNIVNYFVQELPHVTLWFRNIHYKTMGFRHFECPPGEWSAPHNIDAYNNELQKLVQRHPALTGRNQTNGENSASYYRYLDTSSILRAVWDTSEDWNHIHPRAQEIEALFVLRQLFNNTSTLKAQVSPSENSLGATGSRTRIGKGFPGRPAVSAVQPLFHAETVTSKHDDMPTSTIPKHHAIISAIGLLFTIGIFILPKRKRVKSKI